VSHSKVGQQLLGFTLIGGEPIGLVGTKLGGQF